MPLLSLVVGTCFSLSRCTMQNRIYGYHLGDVLEVGIPGDNPNFILRKNLYLGCKPYDHCYLLCRDYQLKCHTLPIFLGYLSKT